MATDFSPIEEEVIFLKAITELIDSMVNFAVLQVVGTSPEANILFHSATHQCFFNILLVDLLSTSDKQIVGRQISYLSALGAICEHPNFDIKNSVEHLRAATKSFREWLEFEPVVEVWFPSADADTHIAVPRKTFLRICGNISKHSILRQSGPARELREALEKSGVSLSLDEAVLALEDFYERFHTDIFNYHASAIAEFLNEIRWGIFEYLKPEYRRSYTPKGGDSPMYSYSYPTGVSAKLPRAFYWELMNDVRRRPIVEPFVVTKYLKMRY